MTTATTVERAKLLHALEAVEPGLSPAPTVEQANCFVFRGGWVYTFDGEVMCRAKTGLPKDIKLAVNGKPALEALRGLDDETVEIKAEEGKFWMRAVGKSRRRWAYVRCQNEVQLPIDKVDQPEEWYDCPPELSEGLAAVAECSGKDDQKFLLTAVHLTPKYVQATDNFSFARYRVATGLAKAALIRAKAAKAVAARGPCAIAETRDWLHFETPGGVYVTVRRFAPEEHGADKLSLFDKVVDTKGEPVQFPKTLVSATKLAEIFSGEYSDDNRVTVKLTRDSLSLEGEGVSGGAGHEENFRYRGPDFAFTVGPKLFAAMVEKHAEIEVAEKRLVVVAGRLFYCTATKNVVTPQYHDKQVKALKNGQPEKKERERG